MKDKSGESGPSYLVGSWLENCEWMGRSCLTVLFLTTAISRFYLQLGQGDSDWPMDEPAPAVPDE